MQGSNERSGGNANLGSDLAEAPLLIRVLNLEEGVLSNYCDVEDPLGRVISHPVAAGELDVDLVDGQVRITPFVRRIRSGRRLGQTNPTILDSDHDGHCRVDDEAPRVT